MPLLNAPDPGVEFSVITSGKHAFREEVDLPDQVKIHYIHDFRKLSIRDFLKARSQVKRLLDELKPDIVHAHFSMGVFLLSTIRSDTKQWGTFHGVFHLVDDSLKGRITGVFERYAFRKLDRVDVINQADYKRFQHYRSVKMLPLPGVGIKVQDFNAANFTSQDRAAFREELGISGDQIVLLFVGRYTLFKGFNTIIEAAERLLSRKQIRIISCGAGDVMHKLISLNALPRNMHDAGWTNDVARYMNAADLLVFPSRREGLPVTVMQAQNIGLPLLAYNVRGVQDLVEESQTGFLVDELSQEKFLSRLMELLDDQDQIKNMRSRLKEANFSYSSAKYADHQLSVYRAEAYT